MKKQKWVYVSPWLLAAASAMLAFIIAVFAVNNYQREKNLMLDALVRQGETILRFVKVGARSSLRGNMMNIRMNVYQWTDHIQQTMDEAIEEPDLLFVGLIDEKGNIVTGSDKNTVKKRVNAKTLEFISGIISQKTEDSLYKIEDSREGEHGVFQIASLYMPFGDRPFPPKMKQNGWAGRQQLFGRKGISSEEEILLRQIEDVQGKTYVLLAEIDLHAFKTAIRRQLLQILFLSLALLLVGFGGWLSLMTLQGFKGTQMRLQYIRKFNDLLVSSLPIGLVGTGENGKVHLYNEVAEEMLGVPQSKVMGKNPGKVLPDALVKELMNQVESIDDKSPKEITFFDQNGHPRSFLLIALTMVDEENQIAGNTLLIQDVSQIKDLQKEVRRNERLAALGKMAAGVAHELRNPLSSIKGLALLLKNKVEGDKTGLETADVLIAEVERLNRSIGELLDYARPDKLQIEEVVIDDIVRQSIRLLASDILKKQVLPLLKISVILLQFTGIGINCSRYF